MYAKLCMPALGQSDHNVIHLDVEKRQKPRPHCVRLWDNDSSEALKGSLECTDWEVFLDGCSDKPGELIDTVTSYIQSSEETIIHTKTLSISLITSHGLPKN